MREIAALFEDLELRLIESLKRNLARHKDWEKDEGFSKNGAPAEAPRSGLSWGSDGTAERSEGPAAAGPERSAARDGAAWQAEKLRHLWRFRQENAAILGEYAEKIDAETRALLKEQFAGSASPDQPDHAFFGVNGKKLDALIDEMTHNEQRVKRASLRYMDDIYRKTILRVATAFNAVGVTMQQAPHIPAGSAEARSNWLRQAIDMATKDFLTQGINCIQYRNGRVVNIATYAEMALRTCNTRAMLLGEAQRREELGIDTVLVSQYGGCSETCLPWQGLVYIDDVWQPPHIPAGAAEARSDWLRQPYHGESNLHMGRSYGRSRNGRSYPMLSVAVKAGLFHPNCRHHLTTWIEGVSKRPEPMDKAEVERIARLEKRQRALERRVRRYKRLAAGTLDPEKAKEYRAKVRDAQKAVREFVTQNGDVLRRDYWRERDMSIHPSKIKANAAIVDKSGKNDMIRMGSDRMTIHSIEMSIEQTHTGKGNPNAILTFGVELNNRQKELLKQLPGYDSKVMLLKNGVNMADLSALTAQTGDEFALFTKGNVRLIIRGNPYMVNIDAEIAKNLAVEGYRWSGHTHPGVDINTSMPSSGDKAILKCFAQEQSVIYDSRGKFRTFEKE